MGPGSPLRSGRDDTAKKCVPVRHHPGRNPEIFPVIPKPEEKSPGKLSYSSVGGRIMHAPFRREVLETSETQDGRALVDVAFEASGEWLGPRSPTRKPVTTGAWPSG